MLGAQFVIWRLCRKIYGPGETVPDGSKHGNTKAATNAKEFCAKRKANTQEQAKPVKQHKAENDGEKEPVQKKPKLGVPQNSTGMKAKSDQKPQNPASTKAEATIVKTTEVIDSDIEIVENDGWTMEQAAKLQVRFHNPPLSWLGSLLRPLSLSSDM